MSDKIEKYLETSLDDRMTDKERVATLRRLASQMSRTELAEARDRLEQHHNASVRGFVDAGTPQKVLGMWGIRTTEAQWVLDEAAKN